MGMGRRNRFRLDPVLVVCFAILFALPVGASIVAAGQPRGQDPGPAPPQAYGFARAAEALRDLPAFSARSALERKVQSASLLTDAGNMRAALTAALRDLLDDSGAAEAVMRLVTGSAVRRSAQDDDPYGVPQLDAVSGATLRRPLDQTRSDRANDAAALLVLAAARDGPVLGFVSPGAK